MDCEPIEQIKRDIRAKLEPVRLLLIYLDARGGDATLQRYLSDARISLDELERRINCR